MTVEPVKTPLIRLAHPLAFEAVLQDAGTPVERLFTRAGLPTCCEDPGAFVPLRRAWALFDAAAQLEDSALGWRVGHFVGDKRLSAGVLKKIEHAPTLYQALFALIRLARSESSGLHLDIRENRNDIYFYTQYPMKDWPGYTSSQAYQLAVYIDIVRHYLGRRWMPTEIGIESSTVPRVIHEHYPASRIIPGRPFGYIAIPRSCLHRPPIGGDLKDDEIHSLSLAENPDFVGILKAVMNAYVADGYPSARKMASLLEMSERTLFRKLTNHGVSYQTLVDDVRFNAAKKLLRKEDLPLADVAGCLGFSDQANFSRMFRRIGGLSPSEFSSAIKSRTEPQG